ncbi:AAA family ATPase [Micromonospora fulviviridis]|uniref:AAA family ATPase n=1 Tax=Micromonospora fulviviridis TaxID=47860 RepID=UPI003799390A
MGRTPRKPDPPTQATEQIWGWRHGRNYVQLIIVDESERLRPTALELLRDRYDRDNIALILIGMPGLEKQFSRYPQFYSRVGFAHQYRPLGQEELLFVLQRHWRSLGRTLDREIEVQRPVSRVAVDSNDDSNPPGRGQPTAAGRGQLPEVADADRRCRTSCTELTNEGSDPCRRAWTMRSRWSHTH